MDVKYILDLRDFPDSPYRDKLTKDFNDILNDDEVTAVAECMGGVEPAFTFVKSCLEKGKSVSTSNKQLVAKAISFSAQQRSITATSLLSERQALAAYSVLSHAPPLPRCK